MKRMLSIAAVLLLAGSGAGLAAEAKSMKVKMMNAKRQEVGEATLTGTPNGLLIRLNVSEKHPEISPGTHAFHVHELGKCEPPFKSAGGHYNPLGKKHGFLNKAGKHAGDLPNIHVPEKGALTVEFFVTQLTLDGGKTGVLDADGSALMIHAGADDYRTDPAGDAGDRVACGVIEGSSRKK